MRTEIIYFSATNTTRTLVKTIAKGLKGEVIFSDITLPMNRKKYVRAECDLTIIATPIYGERIPRFLYDFFKKITGNGMPLVVVSVYGNIGFGISLEQFKDLAASNYFCLIAAGTLIGQHTYATKMAPVAYKRPDESDLKQVLAFGESIQKKLDLGNLKPVTLPKAKLPKFITEFPDTGTRILIRQPRVITSLCNSCGACVYRCPVSAINPNTLEINEQKCLRCYACVRICPHMARVSKFRVAVFASVFSYLGRKRKENKTFL